MHMISGFVQSFWGPRYSVENVPDHDDELLAHLRTLSAHDAVKTLSFKAKAIKDDAINCEELIEAAKSQLELARYYLTETEDAKVPFSLRASLHTFVENALSVCDNIISFFNLATLFGGESDQKLYKITALLSSLGMFVPMLLEVIDTSIVHALLVAMVLLVGAATFIYPHFSLKPAQIPYGENYTQKYRLGDLQIERGREHYIEKMAAILSRDLRPKHVLLYGQPGIGKNELAKSFVHAIETNKIPGFAGKTVIYVNAAEFVKMANPPEGNPFWDIYNAMGRHKEGFVLILDEIHTVVTGKAKEIANKLLSYLNSPSDGFSAVIAIATEKKFNKMKKVNEAFCNRFEPVKIENTSQEETISILDRALLHRRLRPSLEKGAETIEELYHKVAAAFPDRAEPAMAIKILKSCIEKTSKSQKIALEQEIEQVKTKLAASLASRTLNQISGIGTPGNSDDLQLELATLKSRLDEHKSEMDKLFQTKELLDEVQGKLYRTIVKVQKRVNLKKFSLFSRFSCFLQQTLAQDARLAEEKYHIKTTITTQLIEEAIQEELASA